MKKSELNQLSKEELKTILLRVSEELSEKQMKILYKIIADCKTKEKKSEMYEERMSQKQVDEKMQQIRQWKQQIDEGELYLDTEEYEDYSSGYWDSDWITEYFDNQGIGEKLISMIRFAEDCVNDRKYQEANEIYEWLWEMSVMTDSEWEDGADLETLIENKIINIEIRRLALLTLYACYQCLKPEQRAEGLYLYLSNSIFPKLQIEDIFYIGREELQDTERFWKDWIKLLKSKKGDTETRLLKEAVMYYEGLEGLVKTAEENPSFHPALYNSIIEEYEKQHMYASIEEIGKKALAVLDKNLVIRGKIALKAAAAASHQQHEEEMMGFCWEAFCSDTSVENYLRLFGTEKLAEKYGRQGWKVLQNCQKGNAGNLWNITEFEQNNIDDYEYNRLKFYTGDFENVKIISRNPKGSLGWSSSFIQDGIRLFLLYLYEKKLPSKAAASIAAYVGFTDKKDTKNLLEFERRIQEESSKCKVSEFWNYFQRWKVYFPMDEEKKKRYLAWAEKIVYSRADAIVSGQHRNHYGQVAVLLAMVGEIKEGMGETGAKNRIFADYKSKFPRHSSFQREMKTYF